MVRFTEDGGEADRLAPVTPLFGGDPPAVERENRDESRRRAPAFTEDYWTEDAEPEGSARPDPEDVGTRDDPVEPERQRDRARTSLTRSLGRRGLSISEARARLRADGLADEDSAIVIDEFVERGWLDDSVLAEQLVHVGVERKGQGRRVLAQTLARRGIARDVSDASLAALPDDDYERALEFARGKSRSMRNLDRETAVRRLTGQLARRGYGGSVATSAARAALDESSAESTGVRFR